MNGSSNNPRSPRSNLLLTLWLVVALEVVLPIPGILTISTAWVLLTRPPWFADIVRDLYARQG